jgi:hypothetical protein
MVRRNWLDLARKLVDQYDMDYTLGGIQAAMGQQALGFFGEGVLVTTEFPNPFPVTLSGSVLGGSVGTGFGYDPNGQITQILPGTTTPQTFTIPANPSSQVRWDLLVIDYVMTGQVPVPKPSDPITTVDLNLVDDFALSIREGIPGSGMYPAKQVNDIILAGIQVPAGATLGTQCFLDLSVREEGSPFIATQPVFVDETPVGVVNGINNIFTLSQSPQTSQSMLLFIDDLWVTPGSYSVAGDVITMAIAPAVAQSIRAWYVALSPMSQNPLAGISAEIGIGNGVTTNFLLPGVPPNKQAMTLYQDGLKVHTSLWSLLLTDGTATVVFTTAPPVGADLGFFSLVNVERLGSGLSGVQSVVNEGTGTAVLIGLSGTVLQARNILAGTNVTVSLVGEDIVISSTGGGGGVESRQTFVTLASPVMINPTVGIAPSSALDQTWWVIPNASGPQTVTANPQIAAGTTVGQRLTLKGGSSGNYLIIDTGPGVSQDGVVNITDQQSITYEWDGTNWSENARRI